jgi:hypothetical protein
MHQALRDAVRSAPCNAMAVRSADQVLQLHYSNFQDRGQPGLIGVYKSSKIMTPTVSVYEPPLVHHPKRLM